MPAREKPWTRQDYIDYFESFLAGPGKALSRTRFGYYAVGEPSFFFLFLAGKRDPKISTLERAVVYVESFAS